MCEKITITKSMGRLTIDESIVVTPIKVLVGYMAYDGFLSKDKLYLQELKNKDGL